MVQRRARKKTTPCDLGEHKLFDTLGGDKLCALGCGHREVGKADELKVDKVAVMRAKVLAAKEGDDAELLALLEDE